LLASIQTQKKHHDADNCVRSIRSELERCGVEHGGVLRFDGQ
jgi:hypothetical protein